MVLDLKGAHYLPGYRLIQRTCIINILKIKQYHTFEFKEHVLMFQTSSSAMVSVTLKLSQDNLYIYCM